MDIWQCVTKVAIVLAQEQRKSIIILKFEFEISQPSPNIPKKLTLHTLMMRILFVAILLHFDFLSSL